MTPEHDLIPNFTQFPNKLMDYVIPLLRESEEKVLIYVLRCTYGYRDQDGKQKEQDYISYSQFLTGQVSREGKLLNFGAGVSRATLVEALAFHQATGLIERLDPAAGKSHAGRGATGLYRFNRHCEMVQFLNQCLQDPDTAREKMVHFLNQKRLLVQKVNQSGKKVKKDKPSAHNGSESEPLKNGLETKPEMVQPLNQPNKEKEKNIHQGEDIIATSPAKKISQSRQPGTITPQIIEIITSMQIDEFHCLAEATKLHERYWDTQIECYSKRGVTLEVFADLVRDVDKYYATHPEALPRDAKSARARMNKGLEIAFSKHQRSHRYA